MFQSSAQRLAVVLGCILVVACTDSADSTGPLTVPNAALDRSPNNGKKPDEERGGGASKKTQPAAAADTSTKVVGTTTPTSTPPACGTSTEPWSVVMPNVTTEAVKGVRWVSSRTPVELTVSGRIGPMGGSLAIPGANFVIIFSQGALATDTTITIVSKESPWVTYDMLPHGLHFARPVYVMQGLDKTTVFNTPAMCSVFGAYLSNGNETIAVDNSATATETTLSFTFAKFFEWGGFTATATSIWQLNHFSRYILASG